MPRLTPQEIDAYLAGPHVAHFASIREDGSPHVSPVWYQWEDGKVTVVSGDAAVKTRNVRRNPRVALSVATDEWPYQYVILEGDATVSNDNSQGRGCAGFSPGTKARNEASRTLPTWPRATRNWLPLRST